MAASAFVPSFVIICCVGLIFGAFRRMKKGKELFLISDDLAPPPEGRNKRIIVISLLTIAICLVDYAIVPITNMFAMIFGFIILFILELMANADATDGYTGKQNTYRITKISEPQPWDYGENGENTFVVDKNAGVAWVNYEKDRIKPEDYKVDVDWDI